MKPPFFACGLEASLSIVSGKWKPFLLWQLSGGPRRFSELRRTVEGISDKILIQELRSLEMDGVVAREDFQEAAPRVEYSLTEFGQSLVEATKPLCEWGQKNMSRIVEVNSRDR